jgi:molybdenum cofactor biosynthesis enzyme MoaA
MANSVSCLRQAGVRKITQALFYLFPRTGYLFISLSTNISVLCTFHANLKAAELQNICRNLVQ